MTLWEEEEEELDEKDGGGGDVEEEKEEEARGARRIRRLQLSTGTADYQLERSPRCATGIFALHGRRLCDVGKVIPRVKLSSSGSWRPSCHSFSA